MKKRVSCTILITVSLITLSFPAIAGISLPLQPMNSVIDQIYTKKPLPLLKSLRKAQESLAAKKIAAARKSAAVAINGANRDFADYGYWISAMADLEDARKALTQKKYAEAENLARSSATKTLKIVEEFPYSPFMKVAWRDLAVSEVISANAACSTKKWKACRDRFENAFQRFASHNDYGLLKPDDLAAYGKACNKASGYLCPTWLQKFAGVYAKSSPEFKALSLATPTPFEKAKPVGGFTRLTRSYKAPDPDIVAFESAMSLYQEQSFGKAASAFRQFLDDFPRSALRFRVQYWLGQALTQNQKHEDAQKIYGQLMHDSPLTYYGLLASLANGKDVRELISANEPMVSNTDPMLSPQELIRVRRAEAFLSAGAHALASLELKEFKIRDALSSPFVLYLTVLQHEAKNHSAAFSLLSELIQRGYTPVYSSAVLKLVFPNPYLELIQKTATESQLDAILVLSLIKQESAFDPSAGSSVGAQGLMQLMPTTALEVFPEVLRSELANPEANIRAGSKYLAKMMNRFNGNIVLALAAYNAGPGAVDRWVKGMGGKKGMLEFIESIPYRETREYVAAIVRNYFWYTRLLNQPGQRDLTYFWNVYGPPETPAELVKPSSAPVEPQDEESTKE